MWRRASSGALSVKLPSISAQFFCPTTVTLAPTMGCPASSLIHPLKVCIFFFPCCCVSCLAFRLGCIVMMRSAISYSHDSSSTCFSTSRSGVLLNLAVTRLFRLMSLTMTDILVCLSISCSTDFRGWLLKLRLTVCACIAVAIAPERAMTPATHSDLNFAIDV